MGSSRKEGPHGVPGEAVGGGLGMWEGQNTPATLWNPAVCLRVAWEWHGGEVKAEMGRYEDSEP